MVLEQLPTTVRNKPGNNREKNRKQPRKLPEKLSVDRTGKAPIDLPYTKRHDDYFDEIEGRQWWAKLVSYWLMTMP
jgi:hypothetical protein